MGTATGGTTPGMARLAEALRWLPRGLRSGGARRARWGIVDQGVSSFTNFAVTAVVAHLVSPDSFGAFSVALAMYICVLWVARSMVGEPFVVRLTPAPVAQQTAVAREAVGTAVVTGAGIGAVAMAIGCSVGGGTGAALAAMGLFLPGLLAQDAYRYVLMAQGRARSAAANDSLWLAVQTILVVALLAVGRADVTSLVVAFGASATSGAAFGIWQTRAAPSLGGTSPWLRGNAELWMPFLVEMLTVNATPQLSMLAVASLGAVVTVGALRAGMFLFAPLGVLFSGLFLVGLPEAVRLRRRSLPALRLFVVGLAGATVALTLAWAGALALVPGALGRAVLKSNWATSRALLWPMAAFTAAAAAVLAAIVGLRVLGVARQTLRVRIWVGPIVFVSGVAGAEISGASGAAIGLALSSWLSVGVSWLMLQRALVAEARSGLAPSGDAPPAAAAELPDGGPLVAEWA